MSQLGTDDKNLVLGASMCVAAIAAVELPLGLYGDFLDTITNAATSTPYQRNFRFAAMLTLRNLSDFYTGTFTKSQIDSILHSSISNIG